MKLFNTTILLTTIALAGTLASAAPQTMELTPPEAIEIVEPVVPANYARWGIPGNVVVTFEIDEKGHTQNVDVVESSDKAYARNVEEAVRKWRFEQPEVKGVTYRLPVNFSHKRSGPGPA